MDYIKAKLKSILILSVLLIGIIVSVYLVQFQHIFKSRATEQMYNAIEVNQTSESGEKQKISCQENNCTTNSLDVEFQVNVKDIEDQANSE